MESAVHIVLSGAASSFAAVFTNPLDMMRTRMQIQGDLCKTGEYERLYRNIPQGMVRVARDEGFKALQKGLVPSVIWQFAQNGIRIGLYPVSKQAAEKAYFGVLAMGSFTEPSQGEAAAATATSSSKGMQGRSKEPLIPCLVAGAFTGALGTMVSSPLILVKTRLQSGASSGTANAAAQYHYRGVYDGLRTIYQSGGTAGLWHGCTTAAKRTMVGSAIQLVSYDFATRFLLQYGVEWLHLPEEKWTRKNPLLHFSAALLSAVAIVAVMNPLDVVMTRTFNHTAGNAAYSGSITGALVKVYRTEGIRGCYKGSGPMFVRFAPHLTITFMTYEWLLRRSGYAEA